MAELILGDCLEVLKDMPDKSVDAVITDPPYGIDIAAWDSAMPDQGLLDELLRVSIGSVVWFGSAKLVMGFAKYDPQPDRFMIWSPKFTLSNAMKDGMAYRWHIIAVWRMRKQNIIPWDIVNEATEGRQWWNHPGTKPIKLMRKLCAAFADEDSTVLDPFMGSGTTGVACVETGRNFIGIEIDPDYYAIAQRRIEQAELQIRMPLWIKQ